MSLDSKSAHRAQQRRDILRLLDDKTILNGLHLRSGVGRTIFREMLADCLLTFKEAEDQGRGYFEEVKGLLLKESDTLSLYGAVRELLISPGITKECKSALRTERDRLKARIEFTKRWSGGTHLSQTAHYKEQLDRLVQSLVALWRLATCHPRLAVNFILGILDAAGIKPARHKGWSADSLIKRIHEDGGGKRTACVAVCLFSTEPSLLHFRPGHSILVWYDTSGKDWPLLVVPKAKKARAKGTLPLASLKNLVGTRGLTDFCTKERPIYDEKSLTKWLPDALEQRDADRLLMANGRVVFRSLPAGPIPATKSR